MTDQPADEADSTDLLRQAQAGDRAALGKLLRRWRPYLLRVAGRILANRPEADPSSVVQEGLLLAVERQGQFRGTAPAQFLTWLTVIVRRLALRRLRPDAAGADAARPDLDLLAGDAPTPGTEAARRELAALLHERLGRLPERYRQVLQMRCFEQCSYQEIARRLGASEEVARQLWVRAVRALGRLMDERP